MKKVIISCVLVLSCVLNGSAEIFLTFKLSDLVRRSEQIVFARLIRADENINIWISKDVYSNGPYHDTITTSNIARFFYTSSELKIRDYDFPNFEDADEFVLLIEHRKLPVTQEVFSGYRMIKDDRVFMPVQLENPGKLVFAPAEDDLNKEELISRIKRIRERWLPIYQLKDIAPDSKRNKAILNWMHQNLDTLFMRNHKYHDVNDWGMLRYEILQWIYPSAIYEDIWHANLLSVDEVSTEERKKLKQDRFKNNEYREFLVSLSLDDKEPEWKRKRALYSLRDVLWLSIEDSNPDKAMPLLSVHEQDVMLKRMARLMEEEQIRYEAFIIVQYLSDPGYIQPNRQNLSQLPVLIGTFQAEKEPWLKVELGEFVWKHVDEQTWREITGNDGKIYLHIQYVHLDTLANLIRFGLRGNLNNRVFDSKPSLILNRIESGDISKTISIPFEAFNKENYSGYYIMSPFELKVDLPKGVWQILITGTAGYENDMQWQTDPIQIQR